MVEVREFAAEDLPSAVEKAAKHFGVGSDRVQVSVLSDRLPIAGAGARVVVLASVREELPELGPTGEFLTELLRHMGAGEELRVHETAREGEITLRVRSRRLREIARRDGRVKPALSHLATRIAQRRVREDASARVEVEDTDRPSGPSRGSRHPREARGGRDREGRSGRGGREGRGFREGRGGRGREERHERHPRHERDEGDERLEELARSKAREARAEGEEIVLPFMTSRERWVVHNVLKDESGIETESVGEGRRKRVKIVPI